ncbi:hypothetical protein [Streptomyces yangpuensis]|uniref:hypothetical protein n=1 Tax=Streptomyces yangpuensis TaxID=1648182 RepID=UPI003651ED8B
MKRNELLAKNRWMVRYTHICTCDPYCLGSKDGRCGNTTYLNGGEQEQGLEAVAEAMARIFKHEGIDDIEVWQETDAERDARIAARKREEEDEARGIWWGMGGAN